MRVTLMPALILLSLGLPLTVGTSACGSPGKPAAKMSPGNTPDNAKAGEGTPHAEGARGPVTFVKASPKACMLHEEADGYFRCLSGTGGECFHFGATCAPPDLCMYERKSKLHKTCSKESLGRCTAFGSACAPKDSCMYDPAKNRYRKCETAKGGACSRFGDACLPNAR